MKKTIRGILYNTESAKLIGTDSGVSLYRNKYGHYFKHTQNPEKITPVSSSEANVWADGHLPPDIYSGSFPAQEHLHALIPRETKLKLDRMVDASHRTVTDIITELINNA